MPPDLQTATLLGRLSHLASSQWNYERSVINLIASDNAIPLSQSNRPLYSGNIIQEGLRGRRPFAGAAIHDEIEEFAENVACGIFHADHANLQPHSCSQANQAVYQALLSVGEHVLALGFRDGGHLTHGLRVNFSGQHYQFTFYGTKDNGYIDYDQLRQTALAIRPKLMICGSSSYPRLFDIKRLHAIAAESDTPLMLDLSHEGGLIAAGALPNPVPVADVTTMSLDKTLRGPFGGLILCRQPLAARIDRAVHPGTQSSFPIRKLTDAAHALLLTQTAAFRDYGRRTLANAKVLERYFNVSGVTLLSGGTDKHYVVINTQLSFGLTGEQAEKRLETIGILTSRQTLPSDTSARSRDASGLRLGTAWITSRGYDLVCTKHVAEVVYQALVDRFDSTAHAALLGRVQEIVARRKALDVWEEA